MQYATTAELTNLADCEPDSAELMVKLASSTVDAYLRHSLGETDESQVLAASGERTLWVVPAGWPLSAVSVALGDDALTEGEDFRVRADGALWRLDGKRWDTEAEVSYTTGFAEGSAELLTAKRVTLELAARAVANPQLLDSLSVDGAAPSFVVRDGQGVLPQFTLSAVQRQDLDPLRWRRRMA